MIRVWSNIINIFYLKNILFLTIYNKKIWWRVYFYTKFILFNIFKLVKCFFKFKNYYLNWYFYYNKTKSIFHFNNFYFNNFYFNNFYFNNFYFNNYYFNNYYFNNYYFNNYYFNNYYFNNYYFNNYYFNNYYFNNYYFNNYYFNNYYSVIYLKIIKEFYKICYFLILYILSIFIYLFKKKITSNASRNYIYLKFNLKFNLKNKKLNINYFKYFPKNHLGSSFFKKKLLKSRKQNKNYLLLFNKSFLYLKLPFFAYCFIRTGIIFNNSIVFLSVYGIFFYFKVYKNTIFFFIFSDSFLFFSKIKSFLNITYLGFLPVNSLIYNIESVFKNYIIISRSLYSFSTLLSKNLTKYKVLLLLPSLKKKIFFIFTLLTVFRTSIKKKIKNNINVQKAGFFLFLGKKSRVRGVAKNPIDHPHGGRTKSIKLPKTPWGYVAKLK